VCVYALIWSRDGSVFVEFDSRRGYFDFRRVGSHLVKNLSNRLLSMNIIAY